MLEFNEELLTRLHEDIACASKAKMDPFKKHSVILKLIRTALHELKNHIKEYPLKDSAEQIHFFKHIKPQFYSLRIYYLEKFTIDTSIPAGDTDALKDFFKDELKNVQRFFRQFYFYYQYYRLDAVELDNLYFVPGVDMQSVLIPEMPDPNHEFSTNCDYLFSKIRAYELLQDYLLKQLQSCDSKANSLSTTSTEPGLPELKWTGDKVNLVEVIYALYFTGQINNGNADISLLIRFMEKHLQIDLSRAYRDFIDIRNRKVSSPTRFIDQMRESIHKRVDDDLAFKIDKKKGLRSGS